MQIYIKPDVEWKLRAYHKRTGIPMSAIVGELLEKFLKEAEKEPQYVKAETTA